MGAADPTSGVVSQIEVVKGLGVLLKNGWRPLRNIVIASWDAEEVNTTFSWLINQAIDMILHSTVSSVAPNGAKTLLIGSPLT